MKFNRLRMPLPQLLLSNDPLSLYPSLPRLLTHLPLLRLALGCPTGVDQLNSLVMDLVSIRLNLRRKTSLRPKRAQAKLLLLRQPPSLAH